MNINFGTQKYPNAYSWVEITREGYVRVRAQGVSVRLHSLWRVSDLRWRFISMSNISYYIFPKTRANKNKQWTHLGALKVGVNHEIFHVYHFWNFLIFKCTWVCSSSSSKNKNIFLNLSINFINLKMSIYLSISKMCSSLFREEIKLARV